MPYGAIDKLSCNEMEWCSEFEHRHDQLVRVELVEDISGWEPSDAVELARYGNVEEYLVKVEKFYAWMERLGVISSKNVEEKLEGNKSFISGEFSENDENDEDRGWSFLSANHYLESPVLYLSPFKKMYCSFGDGVEYRATKFECDAMPLGRTVDIRCLERLRAISGYKEYNSSGTPREGHMFLVTDLQEKNIMHDSRSAFSWWTTTDTSALITTEDQDSDEE